jgi:hypothetical protein
LPNSDCFSPSRFSFTVVFTASIHCKHDNGAECYIYVTTEVTVEIRDVGILNM